MASAPVGPTRSNGAVILVVEDEPHIADLLDLYLRQEGHRPYLTDSGERALAVFAERSPALVLLDLGLPGSIDGLGVCRRIRATSDVPIVMVTAREDEVDRIVGFELGADDYVVKPFSPRELMGRVRAVLRRSAGGVTPTERIVEFGAVHIDGERLEVTVDDVVVSLAAREFALLWFLVENVGRALTRRQILDGAWGDGWIGDERTIDVHVRQLRRKLGDDLPLATVRGVGYRLK
tara:strand:- start:875 stop:1579 length:705 start_codon:yes stop_codon:yes gene_type:complete